MLFICFFTVIVKGVHSFVHSLFWYLLSTWDVQLSILNSGGILESREDQVSTLIELTV